MKTNYITKRNGFTLIEMVVVIVILGVLAVTAAPRFLNLQSDARIAALKGASGAIESANAIVYGKAAIAGIEQTSGAVGTIDTFGGNIVMTKDNLEKAFNTDMVIIDGGKAENSSAVIIVNEGESYKVAEGQCYLEVVNRHDQKEIIQTLVTNGC